MPSYESQRAALDRRRKLIETMMARGMEPQQGIMAGRIYVPPSPLSALTPALTMLAGGKAQEGLDIKDEELAQQQRQAQIQALQEIMAQKQAGGDWMTSALGNQDPMIQKLGQSGFEESLKPRELKEYQGQLYNPVSGELGPKLPRSKKFAAHRGQLYDPETGELGGMIGTAPAAPTTNVNVFQGKEESKFGQVLGQKNAERVDAALETIRSSSQTQDLLGRLKQLEGLPVLRGGAAPPIVKLVEIASTFGIEPGENVANAEVLQSLIEDRVTQYVLSGGRGITDEDAKRLQRALPDITKTAEGARRFRILLEEITGRNMKRASQTLDIMEKRYPELKGVRELEAPALEPVQAVPGPTAPAVPQVGEERKGYIFQGGDPADPQSWRKK